VAAAAAAAAVVAGGGAAYAAGGSPAKTGNGGRVGAISSYLGLTRQQLGADLIGGQTLAQIAAAQGKSVSGLEQAIQAAVKARLDLAVSNNRITSQQEQTILNALSSRLDTLVNRALPKGLLQHIGLRLGLARSAAAYLGLTVQQLKTELQSGKTLSEIATAQGKTIAGLEQAVTTALKTRLDKAVTAGRISAQTEQRILNNLPNRLNTLGSHTATKTP
jgi:hypothetical protein